MASSTPFQAVALKDLSSMPPTSVTWQTLMAPAGSSATGSADSSESDAAGSSAACSSTTGSSVED
ncbi:MAG: hypothetical protein GY803_30520 [Chloroflexi bacterium]|nr:hypothetical protein [Chloroflexota bacterium]